MDWQSIDTAPRDVADLKSEIKRLRVRVRSAFNAGFWAWAGPANDAEFQEIVKSEIEAWDEWCSQQASEV